ncbi:hypothetical protein HU200_005809 [Digitaria exilis]|uniref:BTB domain-containing protein n=1 Tax=Digitaria exilis TaxID=1010633 RepID=A0A835FTP8_9POAL|nr:hypothetical protein HU200_005809 [Digitaria exilis]
MHRQIGNLMSSEEGANIEFRVGRDTFRAHRLVLSARSPVFRAELLDRPMKDGTNVVVLVEGMEAPVFRAFLTFIYTDTLLEMDPEEEYTITRRLLVAADKYSLERLKLICEYSLCNHIKTGSVATMLELADRYHCPRLKEACFEFVRSSKVLLDVTETEEFKSLAQSAPAMAKEPAYDMHRQIGNLMSSEEGADIEFRVGRDTFRAHRLVLSARSLVFRAELLDRPVKDGTNVVVLVEGMEAPVFRAFLTFIYTDTLLEMDPKEEYTITQRLLVAADKYNLERLKLICEYSLCNHVKTGSVETMLELADRYHCPRLKEACFEFVRSSKVLLDVTETEEFKSLAQSTPAVAKELVFNFLARGLEKAGISRWNQEGQVSVIRAST